MKGASVKHPLHIVKRVVKTKDAAKESEKMEEE
jgi:hypothetical protein